MGAVEDYGEAIRLTPDNVDVAFYDRGVERAAHKDVTGAIQDFTEAIHTNARGPDHFVARGSARARLGDLRGTIADTTAALALKPDDTNALFSRAIAQQARGNSLISRGWTRVDRHNYTGAISDFTEAIALRPENAEVGYFSRGTVRTLDGDVINARRDFDEAIRLKPDYADAFVNRGHLRMDHDDATGAGRLRRGQAPPQLSSSVEAVRHRGPSAVSSGAVRGAEPGRPPTPFLPRPMSRSPTKAHRRFLHWASRTRARLRKS